MGCVVVLCGIAIGPGCTDDNGDMTAPIGERVYVQVERLGNPLVSEVTFAKRDHGFHNTTSQASDVSNGFRGFAGSFVTGVAGREAAVATTLSSVLIPDMLIVQPTRPASTAGWLTWALADGYGGRKLTDDVVDAGLMAIFGPLLNPRNVSPGLTTDNINANDKPFTANFPYLAGPD
jgi:hypothetical protein